MSIPADVISALEDERYDWRTAEAVAKETEINLDDLRNMLASSPELIVRSSIPDALGRSLYTTRKHYRETHSIGSRLIATIAGKVA